MKSESFNPNRLAEVIAQKAFEDSLKEDFDSPFAQEARKSGHLGYLGGKSDDITVAVGRVLIKQKSKPSDIHASPAAEQS